MAGESTPKFASPTHKTIYDSFSSPHSLKLIKSVKRLGLDRGTQFREALLSKTLTSDALQLDSIAQNVSSSETDFGNPPREIYSCNLSRGSVKNFYNFKIWRNIRSVTHGT